MNAFFDNPELLAPARTLVETRADGSFVMRSPEVLQSYARCIGSWLEHWAIERPDQTYLAERRNGDWYHVTYGQARQRVGALAQGLLDLAPPPGRPLVVLSENDIDNALISLAAMHVGIPVSTVSVAYSRSTRDFSRLGTILKSLKPGLIFVNDASTFMPPLDELKPSCPVVAARNADALEGALPLARLYETKETAAVMAAFDQVGPETHARYLLTSGSTGAPKVVVNTHRMLCANQQAIIQCWRFLKHREVVVLDWLPWSHTFGANHNFNLILANGGSLFIDEGRPAPGLIERTVENIKSVRPTLFFNVPRGFEVLLPYLEADADLRQALFERLDMLFYAAAALPQIVWDKLAVLASEVREEPLFMCSEWGSTETSPVLTSVHFRCERPGNLGLPVPGVELKFVPSGEKLEIRVRGESVFREYLGAPDLTAKAFDKEGFYLMGDAGYLLDPNRPESGIIFNGRVTEDFKLTTGTWVSVGTLRPRLVSALNPYAADCVIAGHDCQEISALMFATPALRALAGPEGENMSGEQLALVPAVRNALLKGMARLATEAPASSQHIRRLLILDDLPQLEQGEITDKGYLNQRCSLALRADAVKLLCADKPAPAVIRLNELLGATA